MKLTRQEVLSTRDTVNRVLSSSPLLTPVDRWVTEVSAGGKVKIKVNSRPLAVRVAINLFPELRGILGSEFQFDAKFDPKL